jgi:hypothetical protein
MIPFRPVHDQIKVGRSDLGRDGDVGDVVDFQEVPRAVETNDIIAADEFEANMKAASWWWIDLSQPSPAIRTCQACSPT